MQPQYMDDQGLVLLLLCYSSLVLISVSGLFVGWREYAERSTGDTEVNVLDEDVEPF